MIVTRAPANYFGLYWYQYAPYFKRRFVLAHPSAPWVFSGVPAGGEGRQGAGAGVDLWVLLGGSF